MKEERAKTTLFATVAFGTCPWTLHALERTMHFCIPLVVSTDKTFSKLGLEPEPLIISVNAHGSAHRVMNSSVARNRHATPDHRFLQTCPPSSEIRARPITDPLSLLRSVARMVPSVRRILEHHFRSRQIIRL